MAMGADEPLFITPDRLLVAYLHIAAFALTLVPNGDGTYRLPRADPGIGGEEFCPIPIDPLFLIGQPLGMYHCPYCGSMVVAGAPHPDYTDA
jgi:hypothetical protein